jgi:hypothetical protein
MEGEGRFSLAILVQIGGGTSSAHPVEFDLDCVRWHLIGRGKTLDLDK